MSRYVKSKKKTGDVWTIKALLRKASVGVTERVDALMDAGRNVNYLSL